MWGEKALIIEGLSKRNGWALVEIRWVELKNIGWFIEIIKRDSVNLWGKIRGSFHRNKKV